MIGTPAERLHAGLDRRAAWMLLGVLMTAATLPAMWLTRLQGDEYFYTATARAIALFVRGDMDGPTLARALVGDGYFMPGTAVLASPPYILLDQPPVWLVRAWCGAVIVALWLWAVWETQRHLGARFAWPVIVFPAATASWHLMAATANGDVGAGLLLLIATARALAICRRLMDGERCSIRAMLGLEVVLALMVYLRGPTILVAAFLHLAILAAALIGRAGWRATSPRLASGIGLLAALLLPWVLVTERVLGEPVVTTSGLPLSIAYSFGDRRELCLGPCAPGNIWLVMPAFARAQAARTGARELDVERRMAKHALTGLTFGHYVAAVRGNVARFVAVPTELPELLIASSYSMPAGLRAPLTKTVRIIDLPIYGAFFLALIAANLSVLRGDRRLQLVSLTVKGLTIATFVQPFVHPCHGRYWPTFAPIMALSVGMLWSIAATRRRPSVSGNGVFVGLQAAHVIALVTLVAVVTLA